MKQKFPNLKYIGLVLGILSASLFLAACLEKLNNGTVIEEKHPEEKEESDPSFNASDWIIFK
jgi:hypothetical protein|tara:strand:- start:1032 stop:1217 length:186 start_codon:yes stop_codon:yes gene_type:complete